MRKGTRRLPSGLRCHPSVQTLVARCVRSTYSTDKSRMEVSKSTPQNSKTGWHVSITISPTDEIQLNHCLRVAVNFLNQDVSLVLHPSFCIIALKFLCRSAEFRNQVRQVSKFPNPRLSFLNPCAWPLELRSRRARRRSNSCRLAEDLHLTSSRSSRRGPKYNHQMRIDRAPRASSRC